MGVYYIKESDFRTFARDKNQMLNRNDLKENVRKPGALVSAAALFPWHVVNNLSTTKEISNQYLEAKEINTTKYVT